MASITSHSSSSGNPVSGSCDSHPSAYALRNSLPVSRPLTQGPLTKQGAEVIPSSQPAIALQGVGEVTSKMLPRLWTFLLSCPGHPFSLVPSPCYSQLHPDPGGTGADLALPISYPPSQGRLLIWPPSLNT